MATGHYIISISEKGILSKDEEKYRDEVINPIEGIFGPIQDISGTPWYLGGGIDEKLYHATLSELSPEREKEFKKTTLKNLKEAIEAKNRNFKIFKLEKALNDYTDKNEELLEPGRFYKFSSKQKGDLVYITKSGIPIDSEEEELTPKQTKTLSLITNEQNHLKSLESKAEEYNRNLSFMKRCLEGKLDEDYQKTPLTPKTNDTDEILLAPETFGSGSGLLDLSLQADDTSLGRNLDRLDDTSLEPWLDDTSVGKEYDLGEDTQLNAPAPVEDIGEDINLDSFGSGSGLLDLSLQADDTSLGGILDEIYTAEEAIESGAKPPIPEKPIFKKPKKLKKPKKPKKPKKKGPVKRFFRNLFYD